MIFEHFISFEADAIHQVILFLFIFEIVIKNTILFYVLLKHFKISFVLISFEIAARCTYQFKFRCSYSCVSSERERLAQQ